MNSESVLLCKDLYLSKTKYFLIQDGVEQTSTRMKVSKTKADTATSSAVIKAQVRFAYL